jgi:IclR family pca regulon transcriptional regulator
VTGTPPREPAIVDQELEEGLRAVTGPVRDGSAKVAAAINVSAHASRSSIECMRRELLPPLLATAARIDADLDVATATAKRSA